MSDIKADAVIIHRPVKVKARANEIKCNAIIGGEPCGATVFWVTLLDSAIKIQCITCYTEQRLRGPGLKKAIKLLKANEKNKLLPIGKNFVKLLKKEHNILVSENTNKGEENVHQDGNANTGTRRDEEGT